MGEKELFGFLGNMDFLMYLMLNWTGKVAGGLDALVMRRARCLRSRIVEIKGNP